MSDLTYTISKAVQIVEPTGLKVVLSGALSVLFFFFGNLYTDALVAIMMLMIIDTIFGMAAAYAEGEVISSRRFSRAVIKGIVYFTGISAGYFADLTVPLDLIQGTMIAFVGATEFISILENMGRLGYQTPKKLLNQLKDYRDKK